MTSDNDFKRLIFQNCDARQYYNELPKNTRDKITSHGNNINSFESLKEYAENLEKERRD